MSDNAADQLGARLNKLFDSVRHSSARPFTNTEVAEAVKQKHPHVQISGAYLGQLRRGERRNPSIDVLKALAEFFDVPATYWFEKQSEHSEAQILASRLAGNHGVRTLAARASNLTPEGLAAALAVVEAMLAAQKDK